MVLQYKSYVVTLLCLFIGLTSYGQSLNIYQFGFTKVGDGYSLKNAKLLTGFNKTGFNADPSFSDDNTLLISSNHFDKDQIDILQLELDVKKITRVTHTSESERHPVLMGDKEYFSVVLKGKSGNAFYKYPLDRANQGSTIKPNLKGLTGYQWVRFGEAYILEGKGVNRLSYLNLTDSSKDKRMLDNIGEAIQVDKYRNLIFTQAVSPTNVQLKKYDIQKKEYKTYAKTVNNTNVIEYLQDHKVLAASGSKLYVYNLASTSIWEEVADLRDYGISDIVQLVVNNGKLIVVDKS